MPSSSLKKKLLIFLSHANEDKPTIRELCQRLKTEGFDPWLDEERILPGQDWQLEIEQALRKSDAIAICFSKKSLAKEGYVQREYKKALVYQEEKPPGTIFVIPVRLDSCEIPLFLADLQCVDYPAGYEKILKSLKIRTSFFASVENSQSTGRNYTNTRQNQIALKDNVEIGLSLNARRRYLDAFDSARFLKQTSYENTRLLNVLYAKAQLFLALAFGDTIVVSENQFFDSQGFLEAFHELYQAAQKFGSNIDLPIRVALREDRKDVFDLVISNLEDERFVFSLWTILNNDIQKREQWAHFIRNKQSPVDEDISEEEKILLAKLLTVMDYFGPERIIVAETIAPQFVRRIKQVLDLSDDDIYDLYIGAPRENPERKYLEGEEVLAAQELRDALKKIQENIGVIDSRSKIRRELISFREEIQEGVIVLTDAIYNQTIGIGTRATLIQSSAFSPKTHKYVKAAYSLSTFIQDISHNQRRSFTNWEIYSLDYFENLEGFHDQERKSEFATMLDATQKNVQWEKLLEMQQNPGWQASLKRFRDSLADLQSVEKDLSGSLTKNRRSVLDKKRNQLEKQLVKCWAQHTKNINKVVDNSFWSLTETEIVFSHPGYQFSIRLSYSFPKIKLDMDQDKDYKIWRTKDTFKGRLDERIDPVR